MCVYILHVHMYVHMGIGSPQTGITDPMSHDVGARNQTEVLWKDCDIYIIYICIYKYIIYFYIHW